MHKHRKKTHYKKITIAAVTLGLVGIPTAAMACLHTDGPGPARAGRHGAHPFHGAPSPSESLQILAAPTDTPVDPATATATPAGQTTEAARTTEAPQTTAPAPEAPRPPAATRPAKPAPARPTAPAVPAKPAAPAPTASGPAAEVVALVNEERAKVGCPALTVNAKLTAAAVNHSQDMAAHSNMSHTGSDGSDPGQRITASGFSWMTYGENVAYGYSTPQQVMTGWMNSPGHRENILNCAFKEIGVGLAQPNSYWTQDFGTAR
ncbi:CAP domain-containing protein [Streptomyces sp. NPDC056387]|uniref:CAP domain-containing protein n=1 Tax=Streptomyces sp. NPDC056387 TaxID=3345803 RepID=UPI0035D8C1D6